MTETAERWRRPVIPIQIEQAIGDVARIGDRWVQDLEFILKPEDVARIRLGYVCINNGCFEQQEQAFPEHCSLCGFPMREHQTSLFEFLYQGEERLKGAGVSEELAHMADRSARSKRNQAVGPSTILLPRGATDGW